MADTASCVPRASASSKASQNSECSSSQMILTMDDFQEFQKIGQGKDSVVYAATCPKLGGSRVVLKVYEKTKISAIKARSVRREARVMKYLTQKGVASVIRFIGAFQDSRQMYIVMQHASGGDLLELLLREGRAMTERRVVREVVLPVLSSLASQHALGIIHRDIKLENLFVDARGGILVGDFGLALSVYEEKAISPVGTLEYMPPEILQLPSTDLILSGKLRAEDVAPVDEKVDVWSFGVTVYELVTGRSPFEGANKEEIRSNILRMNMRPIPDFLSHECRDFITQAMSPAAKTRPGCLALLVHPWVLRNASATDAARVMALTPASLSAQLRSSNPSGLRAADGHVAAAAAAAAASGPGTDAKAAAAGVAGTGSTPHLMGTKSTLVTSSSPREGGIPAYMPEASLPPPPSKQQPAQQPGGRSAGPVAAKVAPAHAPLDKDVASAGGSGLLATTGAECSGAAAAPGTAPCRSSATSPARSGCASPRAAITGGSLRNSSSTGSNGSGYSAASLASLADSVSSMQHGGAAKTGSMSKADLLARVQAREPIWEAVDEAAEHGGGAMTSPAATTATSKTKAKARKWLCVFKPQAATSSSDAQH